MDTAASEGDNIKVSLNAKVSPFYVLPSSLHAPLTTLFKEAIYIIQTQQPF